MDNTFTDAVFKSGLDGTDKLVLLGMIYRMDNTKHTTWISQPNLAALCGLGVNAVIRSLKRLEHDIGIISTVGERPVNPSAQRFTKIYKVHLAMIKRNIEPKTATVAESGTIPSPPKRAPYPEQVTISREARGSGPEGVQFPTDGKIASTPYGTVPCDSQASSDGGEHNTKSNNNPSGTSSPNPDRDFSSRNPRQGSETQKRTSSIPEGSPPPAAAPARAVQFSQEEQDNLVQILDYLAHSAGIPADPHEGEVGAWYKQLQVYRGSLSAARLALLMLWAFRLNTKGERAYWCRPSVWTSGLNMNNFLGASRTMNEQFSKWRNVEALEKKFDTARSVLEFVVPTYKPERGFLDVPEEVDHAKKDSKACLEEELEDTDAGVAENKPTVEQALATHRWKKGLVRNFCTSCQADHVTIEREPTICSAWQGPVPEVEAPGGSGFNVDEDIS